MKRLPPADLGQRLIPFLAQAGLDVRAGPPPADVAVLLRDRVETLAEMADAAHYFYATPHVSAERVAAQVNDANRPALVDLHAEFASVPWTREALLAAVKAAASRHALKPPQVMMPLRVLVAGSPQTPAIDAVLLLVGRDAVRERMAAALQIDG